MESYATYIISISSQIHLNHNSDNKPHHTYFIHMENVCRIPTQSPTHKIRSQIRFCAVQQLEIIRASIFYLHALSLHNVFKLHVVSEWRESSPQLIFHKLLAENVFNLQQILNFEHWDLLMASRNSHNYITTIIIFYRFSKVCNKRSRFTYHNLRL